MKDWEDRLDRVTERLRALAERQQPTGLTDPDPGATERWEATQVWAHIAEFGDYWLDQLDALLASLDPAPPFGRTKKDPDRIAAIEAGRAMPPTAHLATAERAMERLRALLESLDADGWARTATHSTLGVLTMDDILNDFLIGHYEQHASQLEGLS